MRRPLTLLLSATLAATLTLSAGLAACGSPSPCPALTLKVCEDADDGLCAKAKVIVDKRLTGADHRPLEGAQRTEACAGLLKDTVALQEIRDLAKDQIAKAR